MRGKSRGFTLLEAIVALAILAAGGMALFAGLNGALRGLDRAAAATRLDTATQNAVSRLEVLNPMQEPQGEAQLGAYRMRWSAVAIEPPRDALTDYLRPGLYEVGLYRVEVELSRGAQVERRFEVRRAGFRQVRVPDLL